MEIVNPARYKKLVEEAVNASFSGWDFNWLNNRMIQQNPPWDYHQIVTKHAKDARSLLDMGTGGGEFLSSIKSLPPDTHATESYPPNQRFARERLNPLSVKVHNTNDKHPLPFEDNTFDLVINRHESFDTAQVYRVLKPGGTFITQQVGGLDNLELNQLLQKEVSFPFITWGLAPALLKLYELDFDVEVAKNAALPSTFFDIGAVIYYLNAIPWQIEGFNTETHAEELINLHNIIETQGKFSTTAHRFLLIAKKKVP